MSKVFPPINTFHIGMKVLFKSPDEFTCSGYTKYENRIGTIESFSYENDHDYLVGVRFAPGEYIRVYGFRLHPIARDIKVTLKRVN